MPSIFDQMFGGGMNSPGFAIGAGILSAAGRPGATTSGSIGTGLLMGMTQHNQNQRAQSRSMLNEFMADNYRAQAQQRQGAASQEADIRQMAIDAGGDPQMVAVAPLDFLTSQMFPGMQPPTEAIRTLQGLREDPELFDVKRQLAEASAPRTNVTVQQGGKLVSPSDAAKIYFPGKPDANPLGMTYSEVNEAGGRIREDHTTEERKLNAYIITADASMEKMDQFKAENPDFKPGDISNLVSRLPLGVGGLVASQPWRRYEALGTQMVMSVLRPDTGAAMSEPERESYFRTYMPQPTDSAKTAAFKDSLFEMRVDAMKSGMSESQMQEYTKRDIKMVKDMPANKGAATSPLKEAQIERDEVAELMKEGLRLLEQDERNAAKPMDWIGGQ